MRIYTFLAVLSVLFLTGEETALAFSEEAAGSIKNIQTQGSIQKNTDQTPTIGLHKSDVSGAGKDGGIEIRIPGIGRLGTLPKLDFGLELLYGTNKEEREEEVVKPDDLTIKGAVKHRF